MPIQISVGAALAARLAKGRAERLFQEEQAAAHTALSKALDKDSVFKPPRLKLILGLPANPTKIVANQRPPRVRGDGLDGPAALPGSFVWPTESARK
jgi:hypothetical protein